MSPLPKTLRNQLRIEWVIAIWSLGLKYCKIAQVQGPGKMTISCESHAEQLCCCGLSHYFYFLAGVAFATKCTERALKVNSAYLLEPPWKKRLTQLISTITSHLPTIHLDLDNCSATLAWLYTTVPIVHTYLFSAVLCSWVEKHASDRVFVDTTLLPSYPSLWSYWCVSERSPGWGESSGPVCMARKGRGGEGTMACLSGDSCT